MIRALLPALLLLRVVTAQAAPVELEQLTLLSGRVFNEVTVLAAEPEGLRIQHEHGVAYIRIEDLPDNVREEFGMNAEAAAASRLEKKQRRDDADARLRSEKVQALKESSRVTQDKTQADFRKEIFAVAARPGHNFAATDTLLQEQAALWKDAGREDLAEALEEDRTTLRDRESTKGAVSGDSELQALRERVQALEKLLAQRAAPPPAVARNPAPAAPPAVPPPAPVVQEPAEWVTTPEPIYISPPTTVILPPVYPPVPVIPCPPAPVVQPPRLQSPPPPTSNGNSNGHMQGSHLWRR